MSSSPEPPPVNHAMLILQRSYIESYSKRYTDRGVWSDKTFFSLPSFVYSMFLRQCFVANASISGTSTGPLASPPSTASTTASPTRSALSGFVPPAPISHVRRPPTAELNNDATPVAAASGTVKARELSHMNGARTKTLRISGNCDEMVDSASRLVVM